MHPGEGGNDTKPAEVGAEWLTGAGPRHRDFVDGDYFTELLKKHGHISETKALIAKLVADGIYQGSNHYSLSGIQGIGKYLSDYSTLATGGATGNLAVTYLGSYNLDWELMCLNGNSATVSFTVKNTSSLQSATRPPVLGYSSLWQNSVGSMLNGLRSGPMSPTTQTFRWTETIKIK